VVGVQFKLDGTNLGAEDTSAPYSVSWDTTTATNGSHTLTAVARDAAGNSTESSSVQVTVDNSTATLTFSPTADATVKSTYPINNFGSKAKLETDNSPKIDFLMKFSVTGVGSGSVASAKLYLSCTGSSNLGGDFYQTADTSWLEKTVTWNTAPSAAGGVIASLGAVVAGSWLEVDLTSLITGDGTYGLRVSTISDNGADYCSKETADSSLAPRLVVSLS
jgi:hypothetical protein